MTTPSISFITTVRIGEEARRRNLETVLAWYRRMPGWEIVVVEQDDEPRLDSDDWAPEIKRVFARNPGPFNRNWGFNVGAHMARAEVLFFSDADILLEHSALSTAATLCARRALAVKSYDRQVDLDDPTSAALHAGAVEPDFDHPDTPVGVRAERERLCFCGGAFFMRRALHHLMGGFDERFVGWGGDDDASTVRMNRVTANVAALEGRVALHLWHARGELSTFGNPHYPNNVQRLQWTMNAGDADLRFLCDVQRQIMGNPGKYEGVV